MATPLDRLRELQQSRLSPGLRRPSPGATTGAGADVVPEFVAPELDLDRLSALTQQFAAPGVRSLREGFRTATRGARFLPGALRGQAIRGALSGFGSGLSQAIGGARGSALSAILPEFAGKREEARIRHEDLIRERDFERNRGLEEEDFNRRLAAARRAPGGGRIGTPFRPGTLAGGFQRSPSGPRSGGFTTGRATSADIMRTIARRRAGDIPSLTRPFVAPSAGARGGQFAGQPGEDLTRTRFTGLGQR